MADDLTDAQKEWAIRAAFVREAELGGKRMNAQSQMRPQQPIDSDADSVSVVITRIDVPFFDLVFFLLKLVTATIPVAFIIAIFVFAARAVFLS